jgi:5-methylcytosine-specific restriction endonuclease McrA
MYTTPQHPQSKAWIFIVRQDCTCIACGEIFEDDIDAIIERRNVDININFKKYGWKIEPVQYWYVGKRIGHRFDADHIVALCNGGRGIGLENIRIICRGCHFKKTAQDRTR